MKKDLELLEGYVAWKQEQQLYPSMHTPEDYLQHLQNEKNALIIENAKEFIERYGEAPSWSQELIASLARILQDEKE